MTATNGPAQAQPSAPLGRDAFVAAITDFLSDRDPAALREIRAAVGDTIDAAGSEALLLLNKRLAGAGADWTYYPPDPLARRIHHALADKLLPDDCALHGTEHLAAVAGTPVVIVANHLSYSDANLLEVLLHRAKQEVAERLTVVAGPKVYSSLKRRFSSLCFGTIKTPQSSAVSSGDAVMNPREVARAARRCIDIAHARLGQGDALLVFGEGTRSRNQEMQQMLTGVTRYLELPGTLVLPVGITGTEAMFPLGEERLHSVTVIAHVGRPMRAGELFEETGGDRRVIMDRIGAAVAALLPESYRGVYGDSSSTRISPLPGSPASPQ